MLHTRKKSHEATKVLSEVAGQYGLGFTLQNNMRGIYKGPGADDEIFNGDRTYPPPIPASYLAGMNKKIVFAFTI